MEKKKIVISSITVVVLLVLLVASSYAYFAARIASSGQTSTSVGAKTLDSFVINKGNDISLIANQDNFALGKGDLSSSTTASVTFTARNDEASSYAYYAGFYIAKNEFMYSSVAVNRSVSLYVNKSFFVFPTNGNGMYTQSIISEYAQIPISTQGSCSNTNYFAFEDKVLELYIKIGDKNNISLDDITFEIKLQNCDTMNAPYNEVVIDSKRELVTGDGTKYYVLTFSTYNMEGTPVTNLYLNMYFSDNVIENNSMFSMNEYVTILDKTNVTEEIDISDIPPELELTIKKNGEVVGTYDITNASSGDYIKFKEYDEDEVNEVYNNAMNQCMLTGLVRIDPVKYATIEACGDDLDCGLNAYQEIVNACNGDEDCENLIYADVDQLSPACEEKAYIEADKVRGYGISANAGATTTDTWEATVTFKNLDGNQNINIGKSFEGYFYFESLKDYTVDSNGFLGGGILKNNGIIE